MPRKTNSHGHEVWTIVSPDGQTSASFIPEKGGVGCSLVLPFRGEPRECLYQHDYFWDRQTERIPGGWPFLFPTCARLERDGKKGDYLYDGHVYNLPSHGFGPRMAWDVEDSRDADNLTMVLRDTAETRKEYPFRFEVRLTYRLGSGTMICEQSYRNTGDVPMPYYAGFHPYFLTPDPGQGKESVQLLYRPVAAFRYNAGYTNLVGTDPVPKMPATVTDPKINERLTRVGEDKETRLIMPDGFTIHMAAEGVEDPDLFPYVQLYTMPEKPFFCVEPWMAFPNALNTVKGVRWLQPGACERGVLRLWTSE